MLEHKISRIITKDQHDNHLGVISFRDFFRVALELGVEDLSDDIRYQIILGKALSHLKDLEP